jgi:hypothetical protein
MPRFLQGGRGKIHPSPFSATFFYLFPLYATKGAVVKAILFA